MELMKMSAEDTPSAGLRLATQTLSLEEAINDETVMASVEEMLEGFDWRSGMGRTAGGRGLGKADEIEKRLIGELKALEAVSGGSSRA